MKNKEKGITLIALVITIIVLLILAGISIAMLTGENGILTKTSTAKEETKKAQYKEEIGLIIAEKKIEKLNNTEETRALIELVAEGIEEKDWQRSVTICDEDENEDIEPSQGTKIIVETKDGYEIIVEIKEELISIEINKMTGEAEIITVKFDANGGIGTVPEEMERKKGRSIRLPRAENLSKEDYKFVGWSENKLESPENVSLKVGSIFKLTSSTTLYAIWAYDTKEIRFDNNGGTGTMESINVVTGKNTNLPSNKFIREGYKFKEWNTRADGSGTRYSNEGIIMTTENMSLYAIWEENIILGSINPTSIDVRMGTNPQITALSTNGKVIEGNKVTWSTSDSNILSVQNGVITPKAYGKANVTAYLDDNPTITRVCSVTVLPGESSFELFKYHQIKGTTPPEAVWFWQRGFWCDIGREYVGEF